MGFSAVTLVLSSLTWPISFIKTKLTFPFSLLLGP
jgi:hypothetical protein